MNTSLLNWGTGRDSLQRHQFMNTNIEWLKELFSQPHFKHIPLTESYSIEWFALKNGRGIYNIKQAAIANNLDFKVHVLSECFTNRAMFTPC